MDATRQAGIAVRRRILVAAAEVVTQQGLEALTIDAVAATAGLTKGGVLYHYQHKADILRGLAEAFIEEFERDWEQELELMPPRRFGSGRVPRSYVAATTRVNTSDGLSAALLAAVIADQATRRLLSDRVQVWYQRVVQEDGREHLGGAGVQACLAADGYWVLTLLGLRPMASAPESLVLAPDDDRRRG